MTALDQAFIKAYQQQAPGPVPAQSKDVSAKDAPAKDAQAENAESADARADDAQPAADEQPVDGPESATSTDDTPRLSAESLASAMERAPARLAVPVAAPTTEAPEPTDEAVSESATPAPAFLRFKTSDDDGESIDAASTFSELGITGSFHRVDESHVQPTTEDAADTEPELQLRVEPESQESEPEQAPVAESQQADARVDDQQPAVVEEPTPTPAVDETTVAFQPMLQVDHFTWPRVCRRLDQRAGAELDRLADALLADLARGRKVLAFGGCRAGEGATTLALCAAQGLSRRGLRVAMVDAKLGTPDLGTQLGLLPQYGFEEVLAGRMPLDEVVIESSDGQMGVVPLRDVFAGTGGPREDETRMAESLARLADYYDAVIVDLGPLEDPDVVTGSLARAVGQKLDTVVLVHNVRDTDPTAVAEVQRCLAAAGISQSGVIENFVEA